MGLFPPLGPEQTNSSDFHFRHLAEALILGKSWWESRELVRQLPGGASSRHLTVEEEISETCPASLGTETNFYPWGGLEIASEQMFSLTGQILKAFLPPRSEPIRKANTYTFIYGPFPWSWIPPAEKRKTGGSPSEGLRDWVEAEFNENRKPRRVQSSSAPKHWEATCIPDRTKGVWVWAWM